MTVPIFIGWDSCQPLATGVLVHSLRKHSPEPLDIRLIKLNEMRERYGFRRPHDPLQSTEFTYTRFLVPMLCGYEGKALFMDCDMLALSDINEILDMDMTGLALRVVKHDHQPLETRKMGKLGRKQTQYPRKNWSSFMLMDCSRLKCWTKEAVETAPARWLHRFEPIPDAEIGDISFDWNVLDYYTKSTKHIHYTAGGPWLRGCENHPYGGIWFQYKREMKRSR